MTKMKGPSPDMTEVIELPVIDERVVIETHESAKASWRRERAELFRAGFAPVSRVTLSEWADSKRMISPEESAEAGRWRTDRVPYLREIMDCISDPRQREVVIMKGAQIGYTQGVILNGIGYYIDQDPAPILVVQPSEGDAEKFSKEKLAPMLRDTPCLTGKVSDSRSRDSDNTILAKAYPGGHLGMTGATSPKGLRARTRRVVFFDEVDGYPPSAGAEGDPITLAKKRTLTFSRRKIVYGSTPTIKGLSRIERLFEESDQRYLYLPCPHCGYMQRLIWGGKDSEFGIKWEVGKPSTAHYVCEKNGCRIEERHKMSMLRKREWRAHNPGAERAGFHISGLYSCFEGSNWAECVKEFLSAKSKPEELQGWVNTVLAELWEGFGDSVDSNILANRFEKFKAQVPAGVAVLTRSVDVQGDRIETSVWGWGEGTECWPIEHEIIPGDPKILEGQRVTLRGDEVSSPWDTLAEVLERSYQHELGFAMKPRVTFIDSGDGGTTDAVYKFCRPRLRQRVFAIKGANIEGAPLLSVASRIKKAKILLYHVGSWTAKETLLARLKKLTESGPGYIHIPTWMDGEHLNQLTAEKVVPKPGARHKRIFSKTHDRNEQMDLWVYGYAALHQLGPIFVRDLGKTYKQLVEQASSRVIPATATVTGPASPGRGRRVLSEGIL
jgi:phage terminase large subunit GpA-like protein